MSSSREEKIRPSSPGPRLVAAPNTTPATTGRHVRVALVERFAMVVDTFEVALRRTCEPIPVLVHAGMLPAEIGSEIRAVRPAIAMLGLDGVCADRDLPLEELGAAGIVTIVLTEGRQEARLGRLLDRGAEAVLGTDLTLRQVVAVISRSIAGEPVMEPTEVARLRSAPREITDSEPESATALSLLTAREAEILRALMAGQCPPQIARRGCVSEATVRTQIRSILKKLDVCSQLAAVAIAYRAGWAPEGPSDPSWRRDAS
ncbi:MAG: LuxR C-terminal-related transcriptional regulator [Nocardioides sp.]